MDQGGVFYARHQGFTLIEVLVAMMIMAILAVLAWQGIDGIVRSRDVSEARMNQTLRLNTVLAQWEQDLASIQESPAAPAIGFDGVTLRLIRRTNEGLQLVVWSLRASQTPGQYDLLRWASPSTVNGQDLQNMWLRSPEFVGSESGQLRTLSGLSEWQVYFFRGNGWSNAQSSGDAQTHSAAAPIQPPPGLRFEELPSGVRLVATFASGAGILQGTLTRDIALGPTWRP